MSAATPREPRLWRLMRPPVPRLASKPRTPVASWRLPPQRTCRRGP